jgi:hypothetical protein
MIAKGRHQSSRNRGDRRSCLPHSRYAAVLVAFGASLLGACTLDTEAASPVTGAPLEADSELDAAQTRAAHAGAAGAPADVTPSAAIAAAHVERSTPQERSEDAAQSEEDTQASAKPAQATSHAEPKQAQPAGPAESKPMAAAAQPAPAQEIQIEPKSRCRPGKYTGVINGSITLTGLIELGTMAGTIDLELVPYEDRTDVLAVRHGRVEGVDDQLSKFSAELTGAVNCASGEVVKTSVERGTFEDETLDVKVGFAGAAKGQYSMDPPALVGTWQISDDTSLLAAEGTWSATMFEPDPTTGN